ncbi:MAG TPA: hypothetical protein VEJ86_07230 [Candidatus Binataceae bacterium]|nr:hypothetical protein [Candidatus Binataceae bacterium]
MRRTRRALTSTVAGAATESDLLDLLESHRDHHFRRLRARRVTSEQTALAFIDEVGFCTGFSAGLGVPCLREAISGEREPVVPEHIQHDYAIGMTWRIKDSLPARRAVYYGKVIAGRPSFVSLSMLAAFLRLRIPAGGYVSLYRRGLLSHCAKLVMDALTRRGPAETRALKLSSGYSSKRQRPVFDRAMRELQEKFLALKVEEHYEPFTYVWDTMEHRFRDAIRAARRLARAEAAYVIVRRHFEIAGFANERSIARLLAIDPALVESAARRLERERSLVRGIRLPSVPGMTSMLAEFSARL